MNIRFIYKIILLMIIIIIVHETTPAIIITIIYNIKGGTCVTKQREFIYVQAELPH